MGNVWALGPRRLREIAQFTGLEIVHGSGGSGYIHQFTTADHRHGRINVKTWKWELYEPCPRFASCSRLFGHGRE